MATSTLHVSPQTRASKLGPVPVVAIGDTLPEMKAGCAATGCLHLSAGTCYAFNGRVAFGAQASIGGGRTSPRLERVVGLVTRAARMVRIGIIGNPSAADPAELLRLIRVAGEERLAVVGYTRGWRLPWMDPFRIHLLASVHNLREADEAFDAGWRPAVLVPPDAPRVLFTPKGRRIVLCAERAAERRGVKITCNDCRVCEVSASSAGVGLAYHGR